MTNEIHYQIVASQSKIPTVQVQIGDMAPFYLHSTVKPRDEAAEWVKRLELTENTYYVVLGVGLGYHVQELLKNLPVNSQILVLHTPLEVGLLNFVNSIPEHTWLSDKRVSFLQLTNIHDITVIIANSMIENRIKRVSLCRHFPAMRLAEMEYQVLEDTLIPVLEKAMALNFNMKVTVEDKFLLNYWRNFSAFVINPGIQVLKNVFADLPVVVVAAGPSLNKNIEELKKHVDKAVIIAAGTAVGALYKHGIIPDFLVFTDAASDNYELMKNFLCADTVLVSSTITDNEIVMNYPGPKCFFETWQGYSGEFKRYLPEAIRLLQTGSVATAAVDFAKQCGARTIILVGQDLAFEDKKHTHADGVRSGSYEGWDIIKIPGYYGGEVDSIGGFKIIIDHFNEYVQVNSHIDFINATEGGALIKEMRNLSLKSVSEQLLKKLVDKEQLFVPFQNWDCGLIRFDRLIKHLQKMAAVIKNLLAQVQTFCDKEQTITGQPQQAKRKATEQDVQRFEVFYTKIKRRSAYPYIASVVDSWIGLLVFQVQDGMPDALQYEYYWNMTQSLQELLVRLAKCTADNITRLSMYERGL